MSVTQILTSLCFVFILQFSHAQSNLFDVVSKGDLAAVSNLYMSNPDTLYSINDQGYGILSWAVFQNKPAVVKLLLDLGADMNFLTRKGTALHVAANQGNVELSKLLINYGAEINILDIRDQTPLMLAVKRENAECTMLLLDANATTDTQDIHDKTLFDYASTANDDQIRLLFAAEMAMAKSN